jgi:RNA polymerase sigma-70 factor (ECF subfamily)
MEPEGGNDAGALAALERLVVENDDLLTLESLIGRFNIFDDITQEVMLKVQTQLDAMPPEDKLPAWVFAVARNAVIDHYRARAIRDHADIAAIDPVADATGDEQQAAVRELTPCLLRMVDQLPEPYREAMKQADFEGLSQQEIADRAGISLSGAKSRVQRARQQLHDMLLDCCKVERDARGNVMDFETTERSGRYCGGDEGDNPVVGVDGRDRRAAPLMTPVTRRADE